MCFVCSKFVELRLQVGQRWFRITFNKGKIVPLQTGARPFGLQEVETRRISRHSTLEGSVSPMHRPPLRPRSYPGTHSSYRLNQLQGHNAAGRTEPMKEITFNTHLKTQPHITTTFS